MLSEHRKPLLVRLPEAARLLGIGRRSINRLIQNGDLPFFAAPAGYPMFRLADIAALAGKSADELRGGKGGL
jgi:hypothetical protein